MTPNSDEGRNLRARRLGELQVGFEPGMSEWGNPSTVMGGDLARVLFTSVVDKTRVGRKLSELKYLSSSGKEII